MENAQGMPKAKSIIKSIVSISRILSCHHFPFVVKKAQSKKDKSSTYLMMPSKL